MRAGACEMHIRGGVCVRENPAGSRRDSDVQSVLERKGESREGSREAGSDRPKEGRTEERWTGKRASRTASSPFLPTVEWRVGRGGTKRTRESQEVEEVGGEGR